MNDHPSFYEMPVYRLSNQHLGLDLLLHAGPRIVRLFTINPAGQPGQNLLAETPDFKWQTPNGTYTLYGGHRLWRAPEDAEFSAIPDEGKMRVEEIANGIKIFGEIEKQSGLQKILDIKLNPQKPGLHLRHTLLMHKPGEIEAAAWGITQLPLGGVAVLPLRGNSPTGKLLPDRNLVLWPYSQINDPRFIFRNDSLAIRGIAEMPALKAGTFCTAGWAAYCRNGTALVKRFTPQPGTSHPDRGCNVEVYVNHSFLELETLGPVTRMKQGQAATLAETWEILTGLAENPEEAGNKLLLSMQP